MAPMPLLHSLLFALAAVCWAEIVNLRPNQAESRALINIIETQHDFAAGHASTAGTGKDEVQDSQLLDIVLVATVDGKFHALNRTSGHTLWSMGTTPAIEGGASSPSSLSPLVRTKHLDYDYDDFDETVPETYIIEPQSGDIYVSTTPDTPLQRFPFSMAELVDMSPFTAPTDNDKRVFIGRKETSLILLELETGKIKATLNSECPPYEDKGIDLDELEDDDSRTPATTEVFIGRTDYHISIYTQRPGARQSVQNLSFSAYGPNNKDNLIQASYRKTRDNAYIQNIGGGEIMSLKSMPFGSESRFEPVWARNLEIPVVAVFDVLRGSTPLQHHPHAFVLLQPRPRLEDIFPTLPKRKQDQHSAFIGMVEETGSLYAMSRKQYPFVGFGSSAYTRQGRTIGTPGSEAYKGVDDIAKQHREDLETHRLCEEFPRHRRCLLGMHALDSSNGHESRMKRLLEGPKEVQARTGTGQSQWMENGSSGLEIRPLPGAIEASGNGSDSPTEPMLPSHRNAMLEAVGMSLFFGLLSVWFMFKRFRNQDNKTSNAPVTPADHIQPPIPTIPQPPQAVGEPLTAKQNGPRPEVDSDSVATSDEWVRIPTTPSSAPPTAPVEEGDESDHEGEAEGEATPVRRKPRRGKRGKKKKNKDLAAETDADVEGIAVVDATVMQPLNSPSTPQTLTPSSSLILTPAPQPEPNTSLIVTDNILGYGSHGTVVFKGSLQGRAVAVKRLLKDFVTLASREVGILQDSDDHPNVIRYYYQEAHANFLYIALELCPASLADIIECPDREQFRDIAISFDPKKALKQITSGLKHLHALKLVHRDIKPQNILVSTTKSSSSGRPVYRMLISDFGLTKRLDVDQTSFLPSTGGGMAAGTVGWRAPEILRGEVKLDDVSDEHSMSSRGSTSTVHGGSTGGSSSPAPSTAKPTRLTKSVDIFALGCLYYYTLTNGGHPYGDRFEREVNILRDAKSLDMLERFGEEGNEACDLIEHMLHPEASGRPDTTNILLHPFFWDPGRRLNFLQDASDRFEIMCRDPRDAKLVELEKGSALVVGNDWYSRLDKVFIENLGKFRKYDGKSVQDLMRALRNKKHHYQDLPENVKRALGPMPEGYLAYFTKRYPNLFLHVHRVVNETGLRTESMFRSYFELPE